jgi:hypothetical protein
MKLFWCWRCKADMPMLDEAEFGELRTFADAGSDRTFWLLPRLLKSGSKEEQWKRRWLDRFEAMTGHRETNPNAIWHHRLALYGDPCRYCGKPLRTPRAKLCAHCGTSAISKV